MNRPLTLGPYTVEFVNHGFVWLDGGAMFGSVPKALWERRIPPDEKNRIKLSTRSLLLRGNDKVILVDVGCGNKWSEKDQKIFNFELIPESEKPYEQSEITDLILTHLHFDHAGGVTRFDADGQLSLSFPNATHYLQEANMAVGEDPNIRERASYLESHIKPLRDTELILTEGSLEILPHIWVHQVNGHTEGQQYIEVRTDEEILLYPTDLIPTSHHLPLPYHMGYDMCAKTVLEEKKQFLEYALEKNALVVFEHDPEVTAVRIKVNDRGHYDVAEQVI